MWAELHLRALRYPRSSILAPTAELAWLRHYTRRIPCKKCRWHWMRLVADNPPDLRSADRYFSWTVKLHNLINARLGKPLVKLSQAKRIWSFDTRKSA